MPSPAALAAAAERAELPAGTGDRFAGYGVMGLTFGTGHVLAMRRFPASSIGPPYTSVWHRDPHGEWTFWQDGRAEQACARYFSSALAGDRTAEVTLGWPAEDELRVTIPDAGLEWRTTLSSTPATRLLGAVGHVLPERAWRSAAVLRAMGRVAGPVLGAGRVAMAGTAPNGQAFLANPLRVFVIDDATATLDGEPLGSPGPLEEQARLGDFLIPQRGLFAVGRAFFHDAPRAA